MFRPFAPSIQMVRLLLVAVSLLFILAPFKIRVSVATARTTAFLSPPNNLRRTTTTTTTQQCPPTQTPRCVHRFSTSFFCRKNQKEDGPGSSDEQQQQQQQKGAFAFHSNWTLANLFPMENIQPLLEIQMAVAVENNADKDTAATTTTTTTTTTAGSKQLESFPSQGFVPPGVEPFRRFTQAYNYDIGHDGRFTLFGSTHGATLHPDVVFSMDRPLSYIRDALSYRGDPQFPISNEAVVFAPGINTLHQYNHKEMTPSPSPSHLQQRTSPTRVAYYSKVLGGLAMAQIHAGTYLDQGDIDIDTPLTQPSLDALLSQNHLLNNRERLQIQNKGKIRLRAHDRDKIRLVLSDRNHLDTALKKTFFKLIDAAVTSVLQDQGQENTNDSTSTKKSHHTPQPHLVLMVYGGASVDAAAALQAWKDKAEQKIHSKSSRMMDSGPHQQPRAVIDIEKILHRAVTVVTVGSVSRRFPDGPAYIHASMMDDPLAMSLGATSQNRKGGGKNAVYLQALSPYYWSSCNIKRQNDGDVNANDNINVNVNGRDQSQNNQDLDINDSHNMDACAIQFLAILMRVNGIRSFRKLYELASRDITYDLPAHLFPVARQDCELDIPQNLDEDLLPAMIRATQGDRWLWDPEKSLGEGGIDGFDSPIPSKDDANAILGQFGYNTYDEMVEACNTLHSGIHTSTGTAITDAPSS